MGPWPALFMADLAHGLDPTQPASVVCGRPCPQPGPHPPVDTKAHGHSHPCPTSSTALTLTLPTAGLVHGGLRPRLHPPTHLCFFFLSFFLFCSPWIRQPPLLRQAEPCRPSYWRRLSGRCGGGVKAELLFVAHMRVSSFRQGQRNLHLVDRDDFF